MVISSLIKRELSKLAEKSSKNKCFMRVIIIFLLSIGLMLVEATGVWLLRKHWSLMYVFNVGLVYVWCPIVLIMSCCIYFCIFVHVTRKNKEDSINCRSNNYHVNQFLLLASIVAMHMCGYCGMIVGAIIGLGLSTLGQGVFGVISGEERIYSAQSWNNIKESLYKDSKVCAQLEHKFGDDSMEAFFARHLSNIETGCCKPPIQCNFNYSSPTSWMKFENGTDSNKDCEKWDNDPGTLCYNCQVCKHGYTRELRKAWTISGTIVLVAWVMLMIGLILSDKELAHC